MTEPLGVRPFDEISAEALGVRPFGGISNYPFLSSARSASARWPQPLAD
jgi:hypothetical protein